MDVEQADLFITSGIDVTNIKLVRNIKEIKNDKGFFHPDMCHQVFGENETIFGYRDLKINIFYDAVTFHCYVNINYKEKIDQEESQLADDIIEKLNTWLPPNYFTNETDFMKCLNKKRKIKPFGTKIGDIMLNHGSNNVYEIYTCKKNEPNYQEFHQRLETLIVWFIDAANFIDLEDEKWLFFIIYEKEVKGSKVVYYPVGYCTVYEYYFYPASRRYRISQFIIFPPFQNIGLGTNFLQNVYKHLYNIESIYDITVEDPSEKFQFIRDYVDCVNCSTLPSFKLPHIKGAFSKDMITSARDKFKINEKQCRRIYEILRFRETNESDAADFDSYKLMVKNRLNAPFKKQQKQNLKLSKVLQETRQMQPDQHLRIIEKDFQNLLKQYRHVLLRMSSKK